MREIWCVASNAIAGDHHNSLVWEFFYGTSCKCLPVCYNLFWIDNPTWRYNASSVPVVNRMLTNSGDYFFFGLTFIRAVIYFIKYI